MKLKDRIMIERLSRLDELDPAEQDAVRRDPQLQAALVENRLLGGLAGAAPPAPKLEPTLSQALSRPRSREDNTMSVRSLFTGKRWYVQAAIGAVLLAVIAFAALQWQATRAVNTTVPAGPAQSIADTGATGNPLEYNAAYPLSVTAASADGRTAEVNFSLMLTSFLTAEESARYEADMQLYKVKLEEYERLLRKYNNQAAVPTGLILAGGGTTLCRADRGGGEGQRMVAQRPVRPDKPAMPATSLARAITGELAWVKAEITGLIGGTAAAQIDTGEFCERVRAALAPRFAAELGSIDEVRVTFIKIS